MAYKDKYSITELETLDKHEKLSISNDDGDILLLHIADVSRPEHIHISLTDKALKDLYEWLGEYFQENSPSEK